MFEFKLPDLGEGVHEGEVLHWHVQPGDQVAEDDPLVEVETDKAAVTIPSPKAGKILSVNGGVGETVAVGTILVVIDESGAGAGVAPAAVEGGAPEVAPAAVASQAASGSGLQGAEQAAVRPSQLELGKAPAQSVVAVAPVPVSPRGESTSAVAGSGAPVPAAPATRRKAREMGIDLRQVPATGPGGRVTTDDLLRYAGGAAPSAPAAAPVPPAAVVAPPAASTVAPLAPPARPAAAPPAAAVALAPPAGGGAGIPFFEVEPLPDFSELGPVDREPLRSIRRKVAYKMVASMTIVPHVAHMDEADVTDLDAFRREQNARRDDGVKLTLLSFVIKAVVAQLRRTPQVNASIDPHRQEIIYKKYYNIGFAADTPKGLVVPVVAGADQLSVVEIGHRIRHLAEKARAGALDVSEMRGGTFTVTNVGSLGGTNVVPTINYPEVAILGLGRAADKPAVRDGRIVVRKLLPMTLSFDHRLVDGADAARFVSALASMLSDPGRLLVEC